MKTNCLICGKEIYSCPSGILRGNHKCCSRKCQGKWFSKNFSGSNSVHWQDGKTPLYNMIRKSEIYREWIKSIYKRDRWTCKKCMIKTQKIHAHHIKPFSIILKEFLQLYSQFSPIEDKETLVKLSTSYKDFWVLDNGITYCEKCHKSIEIYNNINMKGMKRN